MAVCQDTFCHCRVCSQGVQEPPEANNMAALAKPPEANNMAESEVLEKAEMVKEKILEAGEMFGMKVQSALRLRERFFSSVGTTGIGTSSRASCRISSRSQCVDICWRRLALDGC